MADAQKFYKDRRIVKGQVQYFAIAELVFSCPKDKDTVIQNTEIQEIQKRFKDMLDKKL